MKIYLDVDGTLLDKEGRPAKCLHEFIEYVTQNHECFWLTTHLRANDFGYFFPYLERSGVEQKTIELMKQIKIAPWSMLKTEALKDENNFLWFDDQPMRSEIEALEKMGKSDHRSYWGRVPQVSN